MIREILFRGKCDLTRKWFEGSLQKINDNYYVIWFYDEDKKLSNRTVITETIGQFINVKGYTGEYEERHNNEVKLFDGDIVEAWSAGSKGVFVIKFRNESQPIWMLSPNYQHGKHWNIAASDLGRAKGDYYDDLKVIGNIHDNPELLSRNS